MKPYTTRRLTDTPDVADILTEGRKGSVGKFPGRSGAFRGYCSSKKKRLTRRHLKRSDKAKMQRVLKNDQMV